MGFDDDPFFDQNPYFDDDPILAEQVERCDLGQGDRLRKARKPRPHRRGLFARFRRRG
ncbi:MAG: hypothetical protein QOJ19_2911 [Acidimicrobiia bacterium]|jgi:hypothetical protein|nr:hypothetical protein [Acidimicrobiia bacterium]